MLELAYISLDEVALRLACATLFGFIIGLDREIKHKPVGVRPFMLVSLGSAAFSMIVMELVFEFRNLEEIISVDPSRVMQGIIGGIGFLGAGAILQSQKGVVGASTGAGIWVAGSIGLACGFGFYAHALMITLLALMIFVIIGHYRAKMREDLDNKKLEDQ